MFNFYNKNNFKQAGKNRFLKLSTRPDPSRRNLQKPWSEPTRTDQRVDPAPELFDRIIRHFATALPHFIFKLWLHVCRAVRTKSCRIVLRIAQIHDCDILSFSGRPTSVGKALSFTHELSVFLFFINPPCSAVTLYMVIKCISEVRS